MIANHSLARLALRLFVLVALGSASAACSSTTANRSARWEKRTLCPGVELMVSEEAGPDAAAVADLVEQEYRARHVSMR